MQAFVRKLKHAVYADIASGRSLGDTLSDTVARINSQLPVTHTGKLLRLWFFLARMRVETCAR